MVNKAGTTKKATEGDKVAETLVTQTEEKKVVTKKAPVKKTTEKKTTVKKTPVKKAPVEKKTTLFIQYEGMEYSQEEIIEKVHQKYTEAGKKISSIKTLDIYIKPQEYAAYYVINKKIAGRIEL